MWCVCVWYNARYNEPGSPHLLVKMNEKLIITGSGHTDFDIGCDEVSTCFLPLVLYRCTQAVMRVRPLHALKH